MFKILGKAEIEIRNDVYFSLVYNEDGDIKLIACDKNGRALLSGNILKITQDGYLYKMLGVNTTINLKLNANKTIAERK